MDADEPVVRPAFKLSRCTRRKPDIPLKTAARPNPSSKRRRKEAPIPIPSFSPVDDLEHLDTSVLDSPLKKEKPEPLVWEDDDDDDDDLLLSGPPIFGAAKANQNWVAEQGSSSNEIDQPDVAVEIDSRRSTMRQLSIENNTDREDSTASEHDEESNCNELPLDMVRTVDALLENVDSANVTVRDFAKMVLSEHGDDNDKNLRKLLRAHIKARMGTDDDDGEEETWPALCVDQQQPQAAVNPSVEAACLNITERSNRRTCTPDKEALIVSIDNLYIYADPASVMVRDIIISLEAEYGAKLDKVSRTFVRTHLKALVSGEIEPSVSLETNVNDTMAFRDGEVPHGYGMQEEDATTAEGSLELQQPGTAEATGMNGGSSVYAEQRNVRTESDRHSESRVESYAALNQVRAEKPQVLDKAQPVENREPNRKPRARKRARPPKPAKSDPVIEIVDQLADVPEDSSENQEQTGQEHPQEPTRKPPKRPRTRAKKGRCALCSTCSCTMTWEQQEEHTISKGLSMTDAGIERALIQRTKKLEKTVDKYEAMLDQVKRELKKHRRALWKKQEAELRDGKQYAFGDSRFLPDADVWDEQAQAVEQRPLPRSVVHEARATLFVHHGNYQPTLTQMMGGGRTKREEVVTEQNDSVDDDPENDAGHPEKDALLDLCSPAVSDENDEQVEAADSVDNCDDNDTEPVDYVHRLSWREGAKVEPQSPLLRGSGVWPALTTTNCTTSPLARDSDTSPPPRQRDLLRPSLSASKYNCAWDSLFSDHISSDNDAGMYHLLNLFEREIVDDDFACSQAAMNDCASSQQSVAEMPVLTQHGESLAEAIEAEIMTDPLRMQAVEAVCPNWRENVRYALVQRGEDEVRQALDKVRHSMKKLETMRESVSTWWKRQEVVLQLFEMSLSESLTRLTTAGFRNSQSVGDEEDIVLTAPTCLQDAGARPLSPIPEGDEKTDKVDTCLAEQA